MPPAKHRVLHEDAAVNVKEKHHSSHTGASRGRRNGTSTAAHATAPRDAPAGHASARGLAASRNSAHRDANGRAHGHHGVQWREQDNRALRSYRRAYQLETPSSFKNPLALSVLGHGIGRFSPTMQRAKSQRRVPKAQLADTARKHFNAMPVNETDVAAELLYKIKHQDKDFRMRFAPRPKQCAWSTR